MADHALTLGDRAEVLADIGGSDLLEQRRRGRVDSGRGDRVALGARRWSRLKHD